MDYGNELLQRLVAMYDGAESLVEEYGSDVTLAMLMAISLHGIIAVAIGFLMFLLSSAGLFFLVRFVVRNWDDLNDTSGTLSAWGFFFLLVAFIASVSVSLSHIIMAFNPVGYVARSVLGV